MSLDGDGELPGMWEEADLSGGAADTGQVVDGLFFPHWVNSAVLDECVTQEETAAWKAFKEGNYDILSGKVRRHPRTVRNRALDAWDNLVVRIQRKRDKRG